MRLPLIALTAAPLIAGFLGIRRAEPMPDPLCDVVRNAPLTTEQIFEPDFIERPIDPKWAILNAQSFHALHERDMLENDTSWVIGKILIRGSRVGLLVLNSSPECDHAVRYLTLNLFDGCSKLPHWFFLVENDDHGGIYERSAFLTETNATLVVSVSNGELGEMGVDTVFTRTDRILLAPMVDTVLTKTGFEVRR